jgi:hypothetical protein
LRTHRRLLAIVSSAVLLLSLAGTATAAKPLRDVMVKHTGVDYNNGQALAFGQGEKLNGQPPIGPAKVGQSKTWLALNDYQGSIYLKNYTLQGVGQHVEVWVANNLDFPAGDCRNDGVRNVITAEQVAYLIDQFDSNMFPIESDWWGQGPSRDGKNAILPQIFKGAHGQGGLNIPASYYKGEGDNIVVLVDNVRDSNYYDTNNANTNSYIAGFFYSVFDDYFDRKVMTVDAWDWLHRTGADPTSEPTTDPCTSAPARPYLYEGVFAHEYQHLIHHYVDPNEVSWVNEGLSDFTEVITGYADISRHVNQKGHDSHTNSYLGWEAVADASWNPIPYDAGPENSLTAWGDQGDGEILADYGTAMFFMNYVNSQGLGRDFFHAWQHTQTDGIQGMNDALAAVGSGATFASLFRNAQVSALADAFVDGGAAVTGASDAELQNSAANATINITDQANGTPGAPPWGSDYLDLGAGSGLTSVAFDGSEQYAGGPQWVVDGDGYFTNPDVGGGLYDNNLDISIARAVSGGGTLSFDHYYEMEPAWDFGFVQASTDGGVTWQSLACTGTTSDHDPDALGSIVANLPGYNGSDGTAAAPVHATCDVPAGADHIAFRLMTDGAVTFDGWHVKNIQLDSVDVGTPGDLTGWDNELYFTPASLDYDFTVVGLNGTVGTYGDVSTATGVYVLRTTLGAGHDYALSASDLSALSTYDRVVAIVSGIPASEGTSIYQPYSLMVNGVERADGA